MRQRGNTSFGLCCIRGIHVGAVSARAMDERVQGVCSGVVYEAIGYSERPLVA